MDYKEPPKTPPSHYECVISLKESSTFTPAQVKQFAFNAMLQLEGWFSQEKAGILVDLVLKNKPTTIVEIGVFGGKSLVPMAFALKANERGTIIGIDPWDNQASIEGLVNETNKNWWGSLDHELIRLGLLSKIRQFGLENQIELIKSTSADAPAIEDIDLLHIDGNHSDGASYFDVTKWVPLVKSGGCIIFDDMTWYENGVYTTSRAVEWLNTNCIKFVEFTDSCTWGIWIKP